jgi:hypothetical protein
MIERGKIKATSLYHLINVLIYALLIRLSVSFSLLNVGQGMQVGGCRRYGHNLFSKPEDGMISRGMPRTDAFVVIVRRFLKVRPLKG